MKFSVLMSCYKNDSPEHLITAISSVYNSTVLPDQTILVIDGPISGELEKVVKKASKTWDTIELVPLEQNMGLGKALEIGLEKCKHNLVARMDADDINKADRFEKQLDHFNKHSNLSIIGTWIEEFEENVSQRQIRRVPVTNEEVNRKMIPRSPFNHMTVMFKKADVLKAGGYMHMPFLEDYFLWVRLLKNGFEGENLPIIGVEARAGSDMIGRRHGLNYMKCELRLARTLMKQNFISTVTGIRMIFFRVPIRVFPKSFLNMIYFRVLRKKVAY